MIEYFMNYLLVLLLGYLWSGLIFWLWFCFTLNKKPTYIPIIFIFIWGLAFIHPKLYNKLI